MCDVFYNNKKNIILINKSTSQNTISIIIYIYIYVREYFFLFFGVCIYLELIWDGYSS